MQFYLWTWLHRRGVYLSHMEGQWSQGKPYKFALEPLNFADDIVRSSNSRTRPVFKNGTDTLFVNLDYSGWARPPFFADQKS